MKTKLPSGEYRGERLQALTLSQARFVDAIAARILPTTDTPGAVEAGAVFYIDRALAGSYADCLPGYVCGLRVLNRYAKRQFGACFEKLSGEQQDSVLSDLEAGKITELRAGREFFELLRAHVLEGVFGEPSYGGNRDMIGWQLVGFPGQQWGYPETYINKVVDLPPVTWEKLPKKPGES
ncbi:MAG TPA: gluconate 2-dehydrogenase subunit 3 family protein [Candidatus Binatia bacterium]|nr:gluconate 2-dehydrogenase subunit 3 family protein [Candidatus Binatia bacterium]